MTDRDRLGTDLLTKRQGVTGAFGSTYLSEADIARFQRQPNTEMPTDAEDAAPQQPSTIWESRRALAVRTTITGAKRISSVIERVLFPDGYSVFIGKRPRR